MSLKGLKIWLQQIKGVMQHLKNLDSNKIKELKVSIINADKL
jgi:hypothetical protein